MSIFKEDPFSEVYYRLENGHDTHKIYTYQVLGTDTDYNDHLQMSSLFSMLQEAASVNASDNGWGYEKLDGEEHCWILLRMSVRMNSMPSWRETVHVETWSRGADRLYFYRDFILRDAQYKPIGAATSVWIIADKSAHRPVRPNHLFSEDHLRFEKEGVLVEAPPKISTKHSEPEMASDAYLSETIVKYADFSEIDRNLHVNNTKYVAWSIDAAHQQSLNQGDVMGIDICYQSEVKFQEKVYLFSSQEENGTVQVDGFCTGITKTAFSAKLYREY